MYHDNKIWIGKSGEEKVFIYPRMANRHGMIAGATGTGKTVTLKVLAESFSDCGVPVFLSDVKGDLSGVCRAGDESESLKIRIDTMGLMVCKRECVRVQCPVRKSCETEPGGNYESRCGIGSGGRRGIFRRTGFKSRGLAVQRL